MTFHNHMSLDIRVAINPDNVAIRRIEELCIKCGACKNICHDYIGVHGYYSIEETKGKAICIECGQCANVCPPSSIVEVYEYKKVQEAIDDPEKIVIVSTSPSVRAALGESFGMPDGTLVQGKIITLLRKLGVDYVLDTDFGADLTIMEEAHELLGRIQKGTKPLPQFTSCCPAWVEYAEIYHPDILPHLSTSKSPIGMQGPTIKTYFAKKMGIDPEKIVTVALTPCTAKKYEIRRTEMDASGKYYGNDLRDMNHVITTREAALWTLERGIDFTELEDGVCDKFMGDASGGALIFGNSGGVMEAALRQAYFEATGENPCPDFCDLQEIRGLRNVKEATVKIGDTDINVAVIYGTKEATDFMENMKHSDKKYHFIEVMTCPGGCIGGGGQPKDTQYKGDALREKRIGVLYNLDNGAKERVSGANPEIKELYKDFYGTPGSELAEKILHTGYTDKSDYLEGKEK